MIKGWQNLSEKNQIPEAKTKSFIKPVIIFKHSTRCGVSSMAWNRISNLADNYSNLAEFYFLDLIKHRDISNSLSEDFGVWHQSPQVLILKNGECFYDASHMEIVAKNIFGELNYSPS